jgi:hypothetical protein
MKLQVTPVSNLLRRFGSDSCKIATALSWLIYHLCKHPEVQEKVKNEILTKIGKNVPVTQDATKEVSLNDCKEQNINSNYYSCIIYREFSKKICASSLLRLFCQRDKWIETANLKVLRFLKEYENTTFNNKGINFEIGPNVARNLRYSS